MHVHQCQRHHYVDVIISLYYSYYDFVCRIPTDLLHKVIEPLLSNDMALQCMHDGNLLRNNDNEWWPPLYL